MASSLTTSDSASIMRRISVSRRATLSLGRRPCSMLARERVETVRRRANDARFRPSRDRIASIVPPRGVLTSLEATEPTPRLLFAPSAAAFREERLALGGEAFFAVLRVFCLRMAAVSVHERKESSRATCTLEFVSAEHHH